MYKLKLLELLLLYDELEVVKIKAYYRGELFQTSSTNIWKAIRTFIEFQATKTILNFTTKKV